MRTIAGLRASAITTLLIVSTAVGADALIDPTRPFGEATANRDATPRGPVLQSTIVSNGASSAVISGKRVRVGDIYDGAVVTEISSYEVRMNKGGRDITLRMLPKLAKEKGASQ